MSTNAFEMRVLSREEGHLLLESDSLRLTAPPWKHLRVGQRCRVSIDPNDILLCDRHPGRVSARNVLETKVRSVKSTDHGEYVTLAVPLVVRITPAARAELGLKPHEPVWAIFKAWSVRLEALSDGPEPVQADIAVGGIDERKIRLLQEVDRTGSISAAARAVGVTYRTAWLWMDYAGRSWGKPLVTRTTGGRGGGGAALTAEGRRLLDRFREAKDRFASVL